MFASGSAEAVGASRVKHRSVLILRSSLEHLRHILWVRFSANLIIFLLGSKGVQTVDLGCLQCLEQADDFCFLVTV